MILNLDEKNKSELNKELEIGKEYLKKSTHHLGNALNVIQFIKGIDGKIVDKYYKLIELQNEFLNSLKMID